MRRVRGAWLCSGRLDMVKKGMCVVYKWLGGTLNTEDADGGVVMK